MGGGGVYQMRANACKGGGGVLALSMHAFWPLKHLQFWVVLMEGLNNLKSDNSIQQFSLNFVTFIQKATQCQKLLSCCWFY